jgi:hypothetical protein
MKPVASLSSNNASSRYNTSRLLKKLAGRRSPLFGLFGLSRLFGFWLNETNQMNQINKTNQFEQPATVTHEGSALSAESSLPVLRASCS